MYQSVLNSHSDRSEDVRDHRPIWHSGSFRMKSAGHSCGGVATPSSCKGLDEGNCNSDGFFIAFVSQEERYQSMQRQEGRSACGGRGANMRTSA